MRSPHTSTDPRPGSDRASSHVHDWVDQAILFAACSMLAFGVLAFGGVQEWAICVLECGAALLYALWAGHQIALERIKITNKALIPALILLSLPILQLATERTAYFYATRYQLLQWIAYGGFFFTASECSGGSLARKRLAIGIAVLGSLYATFAIIQGFIAPPDLLYGLVKTHGTGFGSYTNRNHYAGLMEMLMPFGLVISVSLSVPPSLRLLSSFGSLVMLASVFVSGSRGGMLAVVVSLIAFFYHYWRHERTSTAVRTTMVAVVVSLMFVGFFSYERVVSRHVMAATDSIRLQIVRDSLHLVAEHPFLGSGLGTFTAVYPQVRTFPTDLFVNAAHNDYVQLAVETGLFGMLCTAAFLYLVFHNALRHIHRARQSWFSAVTLAAMVGCVALLVHSLVDFNLEIPANAATFAFLAGLASARPDRDSEWCRKASSVRG
jgi:O-antigen ligase